MNQGRLIDLEGRIKDRIWESLKPVAVSAFERTVLRSHQEKFNGKEIEAVHVHYHQGKVVNYSSPGSIGIFRVPIVDRCTYGLFYSLTGETEFNILVEYDCEDVQNRWREIDEYLRTQEQIAMEERRFAQSVLFLEKACKYIGVDTSEK